MRWWIHLATDDYFPSSSNIKLQIIRKTVRATTLFKMLLCKNYSKPSMVIIKCTDPQRFSLHQKLWKLKIINHWFYAIAIHFYKLQVCLVNGQKRKRERERDEEDKEEKTPKYKHEICKLKKNFYSMLLNHSTANVRNNCGR